MPRLARHGGARVSADAHLWWRRGVQRRGRGDGSSLALGTEASERAQPARFGGFTLPRRIGLAHRCVAFFRSHCDTVSIPDRSHFSYMALARHVPRAVNRTGRAKDPAIFKLVNADFRKYAGVTERRATIPSRRAYPVASACPRVDV